MNIVSDRDIRDMSDVCNIDIIYMSVVIDIVIRDMSAVIDIVIRDMTVVSASPAFLEPERLMTVFVTSDWVTSCRHTS